jgi:rod shape-determining protein MreC
MEASRDDFVIAIRSAFLRKGNQQKFSLLTLILFSILFLVLGSLNFKIIKFNKTVIKEIIYMSSFIVSVPENIVKKSFNKVSGHFKYYDDYQVTKNELEKLKDKDLTKKILTFENIELKKLIDDYFVEDSQAYAKVLTDKKSPFLRSIVINKGSKNSVKAGMIVYDGLYLIGKVVEVNFLTSRVLLISDINSKVPVTIQPLNIQAIMSGSDKRKGKLQYIQGEKLINKDNQELIVVTSGSGGIFKSGIPIGKINLAETLDNDEVIVNFYRDFSQLKYVKVSSYAKNSNDLDQSNKKTFKKNNDQIIELNNQLGDIKALQQQKIVSNEVRIKLELENKQLKIDLINTQKKLTEQNTKIENNKDKKENIKFLELNLIYGHKCRRNFFNPNLYKINTDEYRTCVFNKGPIRKTR